MHTYQRAAAQLLVGWRLFAYHLLCELKPVTADFKRLTTLAIYLDRPRTYIKHQGRINIITFAFILQRIFKIFFIRSRPEFGITFGAAITAPAVILDEPLTYRRMGRILMRNRQRGVYAIPAGIGFLLKAVKHDLPHHLRKVISLHRIFIDVFLDGQHLLVGGLPLLVRNKIEFAHAPQNILLPQFRALRIDDRVKTRRRLG